MNIKIVMAAVSAALVLTLTASPFNYEITADKADGHYQLGETCTFTVVITETNGVPAKVGMVEAVIDNFGEKRLSSMKWNLANGNRFVCKGKLDEPGFLRLTLTSKGTQEKHWGVAYEPRRLVKGSERPADFDQFWQNARALLDEEVALDPRMLKIDERSTKEFDFYRISFATFGRRIHGYMTIPTDKSKAPFPMEVEVPGAGFGDWTNELRGSPDIIRVFLAVFAYEPDWNWRENKLKERCYEIRVYQEGITGNRESYYYYPLIVGMPRAVSYLAKRPDVDKQNIWYQGTSQGGGFGYFLTSQCPEFTRAIFFVPAFSDTLGNLKGRASGWPHLVESLKWPKKVANVKRNAAYYDAANFASKITCPVKVVVGFADTTCPPSSVYAAFNAIASKHKEIVDVIGMGHLVKRPVREAVTNWLYGRGR